uniref:Uncharacterized protein n=1 Tax=Picea glauca TaxID=3330 RepID=A0A101M4N1_PICGL|nr:hypothetical protein ABT39_MTgene658 [Picea glauca]
MQPTSSLKQEDLKAMPVCLSVNSQNLPLPVVGGAARILAPSHSMRF